MSNNAYLCCSDVAGIYPSFVQKDYDSGQHTVAYNAESVPLLWMGLFRANNILRQTFYIDRQSVETEAPFILKDQGLRNLEQTIPFFNKLFSQEGPLEEHGALLSEAVRAVPGEYISVELIEVAFLHEPEAYYAWFRYALASFDDAPSEAAKQRLIEISNLQAGCRFPPARLIVDGEDASQEDLLCLAHLLGVSLFGPVPWE